jgi:hypothetical protein
VPAGTLNLVNEDDQRLRVNYFHLISMVTLQTLIRLNVSLTMYLHLPFIYLEGFYKNLLFLLDFLEQIIPLLKPHRSATISKEGDLKKRI